VSFDDPVEEVKVDDIDVMQEFEASDDEDPLHVSKEPVKLCVSFLE
jgi:hypothetical protein